MNRIISRLIVITISIFIISCAAAQSSQFENMPDKERYALLDKLPSDNLCNKYNHPFIKPKTESQIGEILKKRGFFVCASHDKRRSIPGTEEIVDKKSVELVKKINLIPGPKLIDVVGIIPGETSHAQFNVLTNGPKLRVGGHDLYCYSEFHSGKIDDLSCRIESKGGSSNIDTYDVLANGFRNKFGKPDSESSSLSKIEWGQNSIKMRYIG